MVCGSVFFSCVSLNEPIGFCMVVRFWEERGEARRTRGWTALSYLSHFHSTNLTHVCGTGHGLTAHRVCRRVRDFLSCTNHRILPTSWHRPYLLLYTPSGVPSHPACCCCCCCCYCCVFRLPLCFCFFSFFCHAVCSLCLDMKKAGVGLRDGRVRADAEGAHERGASGGLQPGRPAPRFVRGRHHDQGSFVLSFGFPPVRELARSQEIVPSFARDRI